MGRRCWAALCERKKYHDHHVKLGDSARLYVTVDECVYHSNINEKNRPTLMGDRKTIVGII